MLHLIVHVEIGKNMKTVLWTQRMNTEKRQVKRREMANINSKVSYMTIVIYILLVCSTVSCAINISVVDEEENYGTEFGIFLTGKNCNNLTVRDHIVELEPDLQTRIESEIMSRQLKKIYPSGESIQINALDFYTYANKDESLLTFEVVQTDSLDTRILITFDRDGNFRKNYYC